MKPVTIVRWAGLTGWYAPRLAFFSMSLETSGKVIRLRNVVVLGPDGHNLIRNGDFTDGMAYWFITSDRFHLPWHIKNPALNVLFDQGIVGLALFAMLVIMAVVTTFATTRPTQLRPISRQH